MSWHMVEETLNKPFIAYIGGRGELRQVAWLLGEKNRIYLAELDDTSALRQQPGCKRQCFGWVTIKRDRDRAIKLGTVHRMEPISREVEINMSIDAAQRTLLDSLSEAAIDPLPIHGFDDLLIERGINPEAAYGCTALVNSGLPSALDELSGSLNAVTEALSGVVTSSPTEKLNRSSAAVRQVMSLLTRVDDLAQALLSADNVLAAASSAELKHPIGMRLTAASGWGQALVEGIWYSLPGFPKIKWKFDMNLLCDLTILRRVASAWRGCLNPCELFTVAATQAALNGKWPYIGKGKR